MAAASKWQNDLILDAALDYINTSTRMSVVSDMCTTYGQLTTGGTYSLAIQTIASAGTKGDGVSNGRMLTWAQQATITVTNSGTATGVGVGIAVGTVLVFITTCTSQALVAANTVTIPAWTITLADVTA